jgi:4-hydroxybenzoate polyprenyltransferase
MEIKFVIIVFILVGVTPYALLFFKRVNIIASLTQGILDVIFLSFFMSIKNLLVGLLFFWALALFNIYRNGPEDFIDIEYNKKTQIKSRLQDCYTGTFLGSVIGLILVYVFSLL